MFFKNNNSLIDRTGQLWKLKIVFGLIFIEFFILVLMVWNINSPNNELFYKFGIGNLQIQTIFLFLGLLIFLSLFFWVKCPKCKHKPIYRIVSTSSANHWVYEVLNFQKCPFCGYTGNCDVSQQ